ncbi:MAG: chemotaxis protein CheX [Phycisphaerales bacterium]|jgi:chemotaxis protein CheX
MVTTVSLEDVMLESAKEVFGSMVCLPMEKADGPAAKTDEPAFLATITFTGDFEGCFGIACNQDCVRAITAGMLCMEPGSQPSETEIIDAIGEIANMVMGGVKTRVQHEITKVEISIPSVVFGRQLQSRLSEAMCKVVVPTTVGQQYRAELSLLYRNR